MEQKKEFSKVAAIYCRVSTIEQAEEGYSIDEQERLLIEYCNKNNYEVYQTYADRGISGKDIKHRPAIQELLRDATEKKFDLVISWKINRISRKLSDAIKIVEILEKYGITYHSYTESFVSETPSGRMQFQMMALVAEFERSTISQNVKMGMCAKARAGEWCGGTPPLGYTRATMDVSETSCKKKSRLVIDEKEAEIVRLIYELYAAGKGYKAIVNQINKEGYRTKRGNAFAVAPLRDILTNPIYIGKIRYNVRRDWNEKRRNNINPNPIIVEGIHEPIISEELWNRVQKMIADKSGRPSRIYDGEYPLTGILKCPECGAGMVISRTTNTLKDGTKKRIVYYACGSWKNKGTAVCHSNAIRVEKANRVVFHELEKFLIDRKLLKMVLNKVNERTKIKIGNAKKAYAKHNKELQVYESRRKKVFEAFEDGTITSEEFLERKNAIAQEMEHLQEKICQETMIFEQENNKEIPYEMIYDILQNFSKVLNSDSIERGLKKQLLHMLIAEITIDNRNEIDSIHLKLTNDLIQFLNNTGEGTIKGIPSDNALISLEIPIVDLDMEI